MVVFSGFHESHEHPLLVDAHGIVLPSKEGTCCIIIVLIVTLAAAWAIGSK